MSFVNLNNIAVSYDNKKNILKDLNLSIEKGELVSLLGPSGCGKTTTLRVIAGLIEPRTGSFLLNEQDLTKVPVHKRQFGMVFQSYALFPHMTIEENVAFGLKLNKEKKSAIKKKVTEMLTICGLEDFGDRYPQQLSGGQRQRVALARALVVEPELLLLDEPLSNLDAKLRVSMRMEIKRIQRQLGITTIFVTHDQEECFSISDKVAVMNQGVIEQYDHPETIYHRPKTKFVAQFIGFENFFAVNKNEENGYQSLNGLNFYSNHIQTNHSQALAAIRPDDIKITENGKITGTIGVKTFLGKGHQYEIDTDLGRMLVTDHSHEALQTGTKVKLDFPSNKLIILEGEEE